MKISTLVVLIAFTIGSSLMAQNVLNKTQNIYYATINDAIADSNPEDSIIVSDGIYMESITINKPLTLLASNETILDVSGQYGGINISAENVLVDGFEIIGDNQTLYGISCSPGSRFVTISNNIIHGMKLPNPSNFSPASYGILIYGDGSGFGQEGTPSNISIINNEIYDVYLFGISLSEFVSDIIILENNIHDLSYSQFSPFEFVEYILGLELNGMNEFEWDADYWSYFLNLDLYQEHEMSVGIFGVFNANFTISNNVISNVIVGSIIGLGQGLISSNNYTNVDFPTFNGYFSPYSDEVEINIEQEHGLVISPSVDINQVIIDMNLNINLDDLIPDEFGINSNNLYPVGMSFTYNDIEKLYPYLNAYDIFVSEYFPNENFDLQVSWNDNSISPDCNNIWGGEELPDSCGVCFGNNEDMDICGVCFGNGYYDNCGTCDDDFLNDCQQMNLHLDQGANLISFNINLENTNIDDVFFEISNSILQLIGESEIAINLNGENWFGSLTNISQASGYWCILSEPTNLNVQGTVLQSPIYNIHLSGNLISYPFNVNELVFELLNDSVLENLSAIYAEGVSLAKINNNWYGSLQILEPGKGYWFVSESEFDFEFNTPTSRRNNQVLSSNIRLRDDLHVNQSTQQTFFMIEDAISNGHELSPDEIICAYCNDFLVGYRFWIGSYTDVPAMGNDGLFYSEGYCQNEDFVSFEILNSNTNNSKPLIVLEGNNTWQSGLFKTIRLTDVEFGDVNQNYIINVQDIIMIVDHILSSNFELTNDQIVIADIFTDDIINIADIIQIIETILN